MPASPIPPSSGHHDTSNEVVLGVDTHVAALLAVGARLPDIRSFPTTRGYRAMLGWADSHGPVQRAGVEGTHSYGAALTRPCNCYAAATTSIRPLPPTLRYPPPAPRDT